MIALIMIFLSLYWLVGIFSFLRLLFCKRISVFYAKSFADWLSQRMLCSKSPFRIETCLFFKLYCSISTPSSCKVINYSILLFQNQKIFVGEA